MCTSHTAYRSGSPVHPPFGSGWKVQRRMCSPCPSLCFEPVFVFPRPDRETDGAGATGVAQHAQEAGVMSAGSAGRGHGEETRKEPEELLLLSHSLNSLLGLLRNALIGRRPRNYSLVASCQAPLMNVQLEHSCTTGHRLGRYQLHTLLLLDLYSLDIFTLLILNFGMQAIHPTPNSLSMWTN